MDIAIRSVDKVSALSGAEFVPGDLAWSYLYRSPEGILERVDILDGEQEQLELEGPVVCRWSHRIKDRETSEAEEKRAALQSADEVFLSLFEETGEEDPAAAESRERLKFFLALQLQRKRILRPLGGRRFKHMPSGRELTVPDLEITPELLAGFQGEIGHMGMPR